MQQLVLIGLGNRWRGDDGIGLALLERIAATLPDSVKVCPRESDDALSLADELLSLDLPAVVVDCADMGLAPGARRWFGEDDVVLRGARSTHGLGIADALPLARALGYRHEVRFLGIQPATLAMCATLSAELERQLPTLQHELESVLHSLLAAPQVDVCPR